MVVEVDTVVPSPFSAASFNDEGHLPIPIQPTSIKPLTTLTYAALALCATGGGGFGLEGVVRAGGIGLTILGFSTIPLFWAVPQAAAAAEMSSIFPVNGGPIVWVSRVLGPSAAWINGWNWQLSNVIDLALYPVLAAQYISAGRGWSWLALTSIKFFIVTLVALLNCARIDVLGRISWGIIFLSIVPFLIMFGWGAAEHQLQYDHTTDGVPDVNWGLFLSILLWSSTGWDCVAATAGDVHDLPKAVPRGTVLAMVLNIVLCVFPLVVTYWLNPDATLFVDGYFTTAAFSIAPSLGYAMIIAAVLANVAQFNALFAASARSLWAMGNPDAEESDSPLQTAPTWVSWEWRETRVPIVAIAINYLLTMGFCLLPFDQLVQMDVLLNNVCLLFEFASYMRLKYTDGIERPIEVPFGKVGAWMITVPKMSLVLWTMSEAGWETLLWGLGVNVVILLGLVVRLRNTSRRRKLRGLASVEDQVLVPDDDDDDDDDDDGGAGGPASSPSSNDVASSASSSTPVSVGTL